MLMAATLQSVERCYNFKNGRIDNHEVDQLLHVVGQKYSSGFENCLREILCEQEHKRPDWISLSHGAHANVHTTSHHTI